MRKKLQKKLLRLRAILSKMQSILIAYSGGADSSLLLKISKDVLVKNVLAVTAKSPLYPEDEIKEAKSIAKKIGAKHMIISTNELQNIAFARNPVNRCYLCKKELFKELTKIARKNNLNYIADGSNLDDNKDYRPGSLALREFKIRSPLKEARLTKQDIRELSKSFRLSTWDKPAFACLASRIPYKEKINENNLSKIKKGEQAIKKLGIKQARVRHYDNLARIEVASEDISRAIRHRKIIINKMKKLGYNYVCIDLQGYRTGSLNEVLH
ncbi:MAG: ATP-dependent sacrificial sulfur transferase LarE [Candidatus Omnitrophica bacterium]|nr:ATP-dependent sacrificial sulfur transferase LarE [Candidatus Omnitrophota bacterium]